MKSIIRATLLSLLLWLFWSPNAYAYELSVNTGTSNTEITASVYDGHVYIQLRPFLETQGYEVNYDSGTQVISALRRVVNAKSDIPDSPEAVDMASQAEKDSSPETDRLSIIAGSPFVAYNMDHYVLASPVKEIDGACMMPLELAEKLGNSFEYDGSTLYIGQSGSANLASVEPALIQDMKYNGRLDVMHILSWESRIDASNPSCFDQGSVLAMNLSQPSRITAYELDSYFMGSSLAGCGRYFVQAEIEHGVNAVFLAALAVHESGFGGSKIARDKNNLFGWGASDGNPYGGAKYFASYEECIDTVGASIAADYLNPGGRYNCGPTLQGVNTIYCSTPQWSYDVSNLMLQINTAAINS